MGNEMILEQLMTAGDHIVDVLDALREAYAIACAVPSDVKALRAINRAMALVGQAHDTLAAEVERLGSE